MGQNYLKQPTIHRLPSLLQELKIGALRIPPFQREFVWEGEQRLHLFDSIIKGLPIGSLMVWRTTTSLPTDPQLGPIEIGLSEPEQGAMRQYLLDGRQRLTSLFAALAPGLWTSEDHEVPPGFDGEAPDGSPWEISYDLEKRQFLLGKDNEKLLPLRLLLDDFGLDEWLGDHPNSNRHIYREARALKSRIYDYLIPVMPLHTDDLSAVTLTFKRVNRAGTSMGDVEMTRALSWTRDGFDLTRQIDGIIESLSEVGWNTIANDIVLKVLAVVAGQVPYGFDVEELATKLRNDRSLIPASQSLLHETVELLAELGIAGPKTLPRMNILVAATRVMLELEQEQKWRRKALIGGLALACLTEAFGNAPPSVLKSLHKYLLAKAKGEKFLPRTWSARRNRHVNMGWARSRVTAIALAQLNPLRGDGAPMFRDAFLAVGHRGNEVMLPLLSWGKGYSPAVQKAIRGIPSRLMKTAANRVLCAPESMVELRKKIEHGDPQICASHAAPDCGLRPNNLRAWLQQRDEMIKNAEEDWVKTYDPKVKINWKKEVSLGDLQ